MSPTPHVVRITYPQGGPVFEFDHTVSQQQASQALFGAEGPPPGVTVRDGDTAGEWQVEGLNAGNVGQLTGNLPAIVASSTEVVPRDEYDAERAERESANDAAMNEPLGVGKTAKQLFDEYGPGHHEVNGNFVWIGVKDGAQTIQWHPRSDNEVFNKDIRWYLDHGLSLSGAIHKFNQQWNQITAEILRAFGGTLASAGGAGVPMKPPFTATQALTLGVDAVKTIRVPHGLSEEIPMPADEGARQQHDRGATDAGSDAEAQPSEPAAPEEESEECRPEGDAQPAPEEEYGECTPEGDDHSPQDAGDELGVNLGLGPGVSLDDLTPASFTFGPQVDVAPGILSHDDHSSSAVPTGLFDDAGAGVRPLGPEDGAFGDPGLPGPDGGSDGGAFGDPGLAGPDGGPDGGALHDPGLHGPGGGPDGSPFGDPGTGVDGALLAPGGASDGSVFGDPGVGSDGGLLVPGGASDGSVFGDPSAGFDGGLLPGGASDGGAFGDPGAGYDAGICGAVSGSGPGQDAAGFSPGTQSGVGPDPGAAAFGGDPGAFGAGPGQGFGGDAAGGSGDGGGSGGM